MKKRKHSTAGQRRWEIFDKKFVTPVTDWREEVLRMLLEASVHGVPYNSMRARVENVGVRTKQLRGFLEAYRAQKAVQRFTIGNGTVWRATTKLWKLV